MDGTLPRRQRLPVFASGIPDASGQAAPRGDARYSTRCSLAIRPSRSWRDVVRRIVQVAFFVTNRRVHDAEDIAQNVFIQLLERYPYFTQPELVFARVRGMVCNEWRKELRHRRPPVWRPARKKHGEPPESEIGEEAQPSTRANPDNPSLARQHWCDVSEASMMDHLAYQSSRLSGVQLDELARQQNRFQKVKWVLENARKHGRDFNQARDLAAKHFKVRRETVDREFQRFRREAAELSPDLFV